MPIHIGTSQLKEMYIGTSKVKEIYVGTDKVYSSSVAGQPILFNAGAISGIPWAGNLVTRPNNSTYKTALGKYSIGSTQMNPYIESTKYDTTAYRYTSHVCTQNLITIPSTATRLRVQVRSHWSSSAGAPVMRFGLLPADAPNALSTSNGGKLDSERTVDSTSWVTYSLTLNAGMAGSNLYRVIINNVSWSNLASQNDLDKHLEIRKVWFE